MLSPEELGTFQFLYGIRNQNKTSEDSVNRRETLKC